MKRRAAIEPSIGHLKQEHRMERNRLKGTEGDKFNALLSAVGMNFRKLMKAAAFFVLRLFAQARAIGVVMVRWINSETCLLAQRPWNRLANTEKASPCCA